VVCGAGRTGLSVCCNSDLHWAFEPLLYFDRSLVGIAGNAGLAGCRAVHLDGPVDVVVVVAVLGTPVLPR
jgi:hypothetical protein